METLFHELLDELSQTPETEEDLRQVADRLIARIRRLPRADQQALLSYTLARPRITPPTPYRWVPERTLVNIICHAVGVKTVDDPAYLRLREAVFKAIDDGRDWRTVLELEGVPDAG